MSSCLFTFSIEVKFKFLLNFGPKTLRGAGCTLRWRNITILGSVSHNFWRKAVYEFWQLKMINTVASILNFLYLITKSIIWISLFNFWSSQTIENDLFLNWLICIPLQINRSINVKNKFLRKELSFQIMADESLLQCKNEINFCKVHLF